MASGRLVLHRYATALHQLATAAGAVAQVGGDLGTLAATIDGQPETAQKLASPRLTRAAKRALLQSLLPAGSHDLVRRTVLLLTDKGRAAAVRELAAVYGEVAMRAEGRAIAQVASAVPLDGDTRDALQRRLGTLTGQRITLQESVDPDLIAGVRVVVGSHMIDGSVKTRLERVREALLQAPLPAAD